MEVASASSCVSWKLEGSKMSPNNWELVPNEMGRNKGHLNPPKIQKSNTSHAQALNSLEDWPAIVI